MVFKDYYMILGLNTNRVSTEEIKEAFRKQAKKYHPDINKENKFAEERFKDINEAYRILSAGNTKRKYDRIWVSKVYKKKQADNKTKRQHISPINEMFDIFFGEKQEKLEKKETKKPINGEDIDTEITVKLEEAYFGTEKKLVLRAVNGKMKSFSISIPAGIREGEKIRLLGQGKPGKNGGKNGNLYIRIHIENSQNFQLEGIDLLTNLYITPWEAALGKRLTIPSIEEKISIYIPEGTQSDDKITIPGKGYKDGQGGRGNLIIKINIAMPKNLQDEEKELFKQLATISKFSPRDTATR